MANNTLTSLLQHIDRDEIVNKLLLDYDEESINKWLAEKYTGADEKKLIVSVRALKEFKKNHLDIYKTIQEDLMKTKIAVKGNNEDDITLSIQNLPAYKDILLKSANEELDIRSIVKRLCHAIELRFSQIFDEIQADPRNINTGIDRLLINYTEVLGNILEKYYKFTEAPDNVNITNNITVNTVNQHISTFHDVIKDVLSEMDTDASLYFIEVFNKKFNELKAPGEAVVVSSAERLAKVQVLNETINDKLNQ